MANKEVANKNTGSVPVSMADIEKYAGAGFEEASADSYAIPFLQILQKIKLLLHMPKQRRTRLQRLI